MNLQSLKPLQETKYLSADNAWRYRAIMRIFYLYDQKFRHWLNKEDVYETLAGDDRFAGYTMDMCKQDLDALRDWGNLSAVQDTARAATYEQFVNKQFRYQMTEYAIEIERMTIRLENLFIEGGSLEPTLLERIKESLEKIEAMAGADQKTLGGWWSQLTGDFQRLNQNYQDYIRDWHSIKMDELMKTKHFLVYKEKLTEYLRYFIKELQAHGAVIERLLNGMSEEKLAALFSRIADYEMDIPRVDMEKIRREDIQANIAGKYESLKHFFCGAQSEVEMILSMTSEIIRRLTRYAASILELTTQYSSRREEYRKVMALFRKTKSLEEAHLLSAQVFGIDSWKHFCGSQERETENIQSSIYDESPTQVLLVPRVRTYRERLEKTAIPDNRAAKAATLEQVLREKDEERRILSSYLENGRIEFGALDKVPSKVRRTLMRWLMKGLREKGGHATTEYGHRYRVGNPGETTRCLLRCEDGDMEMPAYILEFEVAR